jgi:hypothetical protein
METFIILLIFYMICFNLWNYYIYNSTTPLFPSIMFMIAFSFGLWTICHILLWNINHISITITH